VLGRQEFEDIVTDADAPVVVTAARPTPVAAAAKGAGAGGGASGSGSGGGKVRLGIHLHVPGSQCSTGDALAVRQALVDMLSGGWSSGSGSGSGSRAGSGAAPPALRAWRPLGSVDWETALDRQVYGAGCGLRMLGSLKVKKGVRVGEGRPYALVGGVGRGGEEVGLGEAARDPAALLELVSMHLPIGA